MCSLSMPIIGMDNNYQGDLTDILRANSIGPSTINSIKPSSTLVTMEEEEEEEDTRGGVPDSFGDPFSSYIRDPLLHELTSSSSSSFFTSSTPEMNMEASSHRVAPFSELQHQQGEVAKRPLASGSNIFSRMIQISPDGDVAGCEGGGGGGVVGSDMINGINSRGCLIENTGVALQISSPRNPGIKPRKSQAKKVVCVPAPAAVNSKPTGEVVPSDLWAWRKYGQKPIKGSPYPRGYYRCSSSKGCSARKQVERSRTDPNMLVITYTSEHNHPWPTQRNALAGSTRSQPLKAGNSKTSNTSSSHHQKPSSPTKEEQKVAIADGMNEDNNNATIGSSSSVKEEFEDDIEKMQLEIDGQPDQGFSYRPSMANENLHYQGDDFFADLGEIGGADPLNLLFSQCFTEDEQQKGASKGDMDPFSIFDWSTDQNTTINNDSSFGHEAKRPL